MGRNVLGMQIYASTETTTFAAGTGTDERVPGVQAHNAADERCRGSRLTMRLEVKTERGTASLNFQPFLVFINHLKYNLIVFMLCIIKY